MTKREFLKFCGAFATGLGFKCSSQPKMLPTSSQKNWLALKYGMLISFGPKTIHVDANGKKLQCISDFCPQIIDTDQWANIAYEAGMKYAVLTTKHHDGFCLWPSKYTNHSVKYSALKLDLVGQFIESFTKVGLKVGFQYSLCDRNFRNENNGKGYFVYVRNQVTELLTRYGKIVEIRFIGGCNKDYSRQDQDDAINRPDTHKLTGDLKIYKWQKLYSLVHLLQPDCLVIHDVNHENTDAIDFPVDVRAFDYKQFLLEGDIIRPEVNLIVRKQTGEKVYVPIEYCTSLTPNIFWASQEKIIHPSAETISQWYRGAIRARSNLLLNIGPNSYGLIPEYHQTYLRKTAKLVGIS